MSCSRDEALNHITGSARYWLRNDDPDYPMCKTKEDAIYSAIYHVYHYHYKALTVDDIKEARKRFRLPEEDTDCFEIIKK